MIDAPFNLEATVRLLQRRPSNLVDRWEDGRYLRAFATADGVRRMAVSNAGSVDAPDVRIEVLDRPVPEETQRLLVSTVRRMLGLDVPPSPVEWLAAEEPRLAPTAEALRGFRPPVFPTLFETCAAVLPFQQLSLDAGTAILGRLVARFGPALTADDGVWYAFPSPASIAGAPAEALRAVGLSRTKAAALQHLANQAVAGELDAAQFENLSTVAALKALQALPGIGPWSAGLILLRGLRRLDVFPPGDVGAARNLAALLGLAAPLTPVEASRFAARFGDRRGYLYFLSLGAQLLARGLITPVPPGSEGRHASRPPRR